MRAPLRFGPKGWLPASGLAAKDRFAFFPEMKIRIGAYLWLNFLSMSCDAATPQWALRHHKMLLVL
jgi:hypothetical protein